MTLQQLKYVITVAETGTITEAANRLYVSQPSLTNAIHELEKEMNIVIFNRTNKGITLSKEGDDFLGYARQVLEQAAILEDKYKGNPGAKTVLRIHPALFLCRQRIRGPDQTVRAGRIRFQPAGDTDL